MNELFQYLQPDAFAHVRNGRLSTSGLKSGVTVVFLDPDFFNDAKISAIRVHRIACIFRTSWPKMGVWRGAK